MKIVLLFCFFLGLLATTRCAELWALQVRRNHVEGRSLFDTLTEVTAIMEDIKRSDLPSICVDGLSMVRGLDMHWMLKFIITISYESCKIVRPFYWLLFSSTKPKNVNGFGFKTIFS